MIKLTLIGYYLMVHNQILQQAMYLQLVKLRIYPKSSLVLRWLSLNKFNFLFLPDILEFFLNLPYHAFLDFHKKI